MALDAGMAVIAASPWPDIFSLRAILHAKPPKGVNPGTRFAALVSNVLPGRRRAARSPGRTVWIWSIYPPSAQSRPHCWHQNAKSGRGGPQIAVMVIKPLTMIKGTLPLTVLFDPPDR
jgi:hypothetical protein